MNGLFWIAFLVILYTYIGYPLLLMFFVRLKQRETLRDDGFVPSLSLIIAAHNEEKVIGRKIEKTLELNYPKKKLEVIIASDASEDRTDEIVQGFSKEGVVLVRQHQRRGKTAAQNLAVGVAKGEILVFSDATTVFKKDALKKLVRHFINPSVGCVAGREKFIKSRHEISQEASFFWNYELFLRSQESKFNSLISVSGCIFALRKELYKPLGDGLIEDFALPLQVVAKGYRVAYAEDAIGYERAAKDTKSEFTRKARIVSGAIHVVYTMKHLLNPLRYPLLSFQLISHKILRWLAPVFMIVLFISNIGLLFENGLFLLLGLAQIGFYGLGLAGYFLQIRHKLPKLLKIVYHFCVINFSAILGIVNFLKGDRRVIWQPVR
ncbi:glycosyltransferase family 2 protein [Candidatus Omnitrophota bacterium]